jgi:dihydrofolate synthase/folylpolyglutamate synthase
MPDTSLASWLQRVEHQHEKSIQLGLERVDIVWKRLTSDIPELRSRKEKPKTISVAGTNGKGSTVACMEALLLAHNYSVGCYTSPHFFSYNERIRVNGKMVPNNDLVEAFEIIHDASKGIPLTYFEYGTLAALKLFLEADIEVQLLEVGLGGRLDAVNIVDSDVAVVTSIDLDHQAWLGETLLDIAGEKLGIARANRPLVWGESSHFNCYEPSITKTDAVLLKIGEHFNIQQHGRCSEIICKTSSNKPATFENLKDTGIPINSKALALQALIAAELAIDCAISSDALNEIELMGRYQSAQFHGTSIILDVAHNPAAARMLAQRLEKLSGSIFAVASVLDDKDWDGIVDSLQPLIKSWRIAEISSSSRSMREHDMLKVLYNKGLAGSAYETIELALLDAIRASCEGDTVLVMGSFHTVADALRVIEPEGDWA